ncbi:MAG: DinB family protein, partial [Gemmatimonadales bacterium]
MTFSLAEARPILARTPTVVRSLLAGLAEPWINATEGPDTWSPRDVVAHLTDLEEQDWMVRVRLIMEEGDARAFPPVDRVRFRSTLAGRSVDQLLVLFAERRAQSLQALDALRLGPGDLTRRGLHPALGTVTLEQLLATWVVHD